VEAEAAPEVVDDFDVGLDEKLDLMDREENVAKLKKRVEKKAVTVLHAPRLGTKQNKS
jgi:ubiquitin-like domain-containing CTD phosphatase 1